MKNVENPWVYPWWLWVATIVVAVLALTLVLDRTSSTKTWARIAPLETVRVQKGDTGIEIMRSLLPTDRKETENLDFLLEVVASRTGEEYGAISPGQELQMPIPYEDWLQRRIWFW